jgi:hypothetical protein
MVFLNKSAMNRTTLSFLFIVTLLAMSCKREYAGTVDENYLGEWHSQNTFETEDGLTREIYLYIGHEKTSRYGFLCEIDCASCSCQLFTTGKAKLNADKTKLHIGSGNFKARIALGINVAPHINADGAWECTINDIVMIKN